VRVTLRDYDVEVEQISNPIHSSWRQFIDRIKQDENGDSYEEGIYEGANPTGP
jgi:hypothetical protein